MKKFPFISLWLLKLSKVGSRTSEFVDDTETDRVVTGKLETSGDVSLKEKSVGKVGDDISGPVSTLSVAVAKLTFAVVSNELCVKTLAVEDEIAKLVEKEEDTILKESLAIGTEDSTTDASEDVLGDIVSVNPEFPDVTVTRLSVLVLEVL